MRITSTSYYNEIYSENNKLNRQLFDVNRQISSGIKIQYAHDNPSIFVDTLRLDDEITTFTQVKASAQSAYKFSTQTDTTIGNIVSSLESMKVKLVNAANGSNSDTSLQAIAKEMRGIKNNLLTLANTSIGGQYLFSGTATSVKPIAADGTYQGNDQNLEAFLGFGVNQKYNISGSQLFLGEESKINRTITTNLPQKSLTELYPDIMQDPSIPRTAATEKYITSTSTIRDLMGDTDSNTGNDAWQSYFYVQGTNHDGTSFKTKITMNMTDTVGDLMQQISNAYGVDMVDVTLNPNGQIEIVDKQKGSSKLDFHMVGAVDFSAGAAANVANIDLLQAGTTDFLTASTTPGLYVKEFTRSSFTPSNPANTIEGIQYDRTYFTQNGAKLTSNIPQINKTDNSIAAPTTKMVDVSGAATLNGRQLIINGTDITGAAINAQINFSNAGSTFTVGGNTYSIFDTGNPRAAVAADQMTYQQFYDVINMIMSGTPPAANTATDYDTAIATSNTLSKTTVDADGRLVFQDYTAPVTQASMTVYDPTSSDYSVTTGAALAFNANSALTIRDPKNDFFAQIEEMIKSVEEGKTRANGTDSTDPRNIGMQNSIQMIDDLADHVTRMQTEAGSYSQVLQATGDRTDLLIVSTKSLRSDVIDTDVAESTLHLQQLNLNYQALLSTISKASKLSLVNYL